MWARHGRRIALIAAFLMIVSVLLHLLIVTIPHRVHCAARKPSNTCTMADGCAALPASGAVIATVNQTERQEYQVFLLKDAKRFQSKMTDWAGG